MLDCPEVVEPQPSLRHVAARSPRSSTTFVCSFARAGHPAPVCGRRSLGRRRKQIVDRLLGMPLERTRFGRAGSRRPGAASGELRDPLFAELQARGLRGRASTALWWPPSPPMLAAAVSSYHHRRGGRSPRRQGRGSVGQTATHGLGRDRAPAPAGGIVVNEVRPDVPPQISRERPSANGWRVPITDPHDGRDRAAGFNSPFGAASAPGSGPSSRSTRSLSSPTRTFPAQGAVAPWAATSGASEYFRESSRRLPRRCPSRWTRRGAPCPNGRRTPSSVGATTRSTSTYRNRYGRERSYSTGFEGAVPFVKRRHAETDSDWSQERYEGFMRRIPCPSAAAAGAQARVAGRAHRWPLDRGRPALSIRMPRRSSMTSTSPTASGRSPSGSSGGQRPARLPARCGPGLPEPGPGRGDSPAGGPTHPIRHPDRFRPGRRALRLDRPSASVCTSATTTG